MCDVPGAMSVSKTIFPENAELFPTIASAMQHQLGLPPGSDKVSPPAGRRYKLWEMEPELHCSVIGTCVPVPELRRIYRRIKGEATKTLGDYEIHGLFVHRAAEASVGIRLLQKFLERTYQASIQRFKSCETEAELGVLWKQAMDNGQVAGAYWALLSHARVTPALVNRAFGEVHMLSHLAGHEAQADQRRLQNLAQARDAQRQRLEVKAKQVQQLQCEHEQVRTALRKYRCELKVQTKARRALQQELDSLKQQTGLNALYKRIGELEIQLARAEQRTQDEAQQREALNDENARLREQLSEQRRERSALSARLAELLEGSAAPCGRRQDLCGRCILYVGGRGRIQPRFQHLVTRMNGRYLHHDGGLEDGVKRLPELLAQADVVLCPLDCVSHNAVDEIKSFCKRESKPVILLRRSSLAAFNSALDEIAA